LDKLIKEETDLGQETDGELFIGIVSAIGVNSSRFITELCEHLTMFEYNENKTIKVSDLIKTSCEKAKISTWNKEMNKYDIAVKKIDCGNKLRAKFKDDILSKFIIEEIYEERVKKNLSDKNYILKELKNAEKIANAKGDENKKGSFSFEVGES